MMLDYLYYSHGQTGFFGELFPDVPRWLGCLRERSFQNLQLLGFDGGARAPSFRARAPVAAAAARPSVGAFVFRLTVPRFRIAIQ